MAALLARSGAAALALVATAPSPPSSFAFIPVNNACCNSLLRRDVGKTRWRLRPIDVAVAPRGGGCDDAVEGSGASSAAPCVNGADVASSIGELDALIADANRRLDERDADGAFAVLAQAFGLDPTSPILSRLFERCLGLKVDLAQERYYRWKDSASSSSSEGDNDANIMPEADLNELFQDRMGLSSLYIDGERYDEAGAQLRTAIGEVTFWLDRSPRSKSQSTHDVEVNSADCPPAEFDRWQPQLDRARYLLYRTNAACCRWDAYFEDGDELRRSARGALHPFDALKFPCASLDLASDIARSYARRALRSVGVNDADDVDVSGRSNLPRTVVSVSRHRADDDYMKQSSGRKIRVGYISPDFTSRHPLAFLMQHVFRYHDKSEFVVHIYSVSSSGDDDDKGPEVRAIIDSADAFVNLSPSSMSPVDMYRRVMEDELDVLVDLCGYAGTSVVSEVMASRCRLRRENQQQRQQQQPRQATKFPIHVSYMGFPGSIGSAKVWDYSVFDPIVVPPDETFGIRQHYDEALVYMPHCYFVNSHKTAIGDEGDGIMIASEDERRELRTRYGIHPNAFVYCCHSRPDKIDPATFRSWMSAISRVRAASGDDVPPVLWLLRSGNEMEMNIRKWVREEFGPREEDCLVFANIAERAEHLKRLGIADVFLDTPAYNAHTLGCDALYMGMPMISLLRLSGQTGVNSAGDDNLDLNFADTDVSLNGKQGARAIATTKLASRVGASLLMAIGLDNLILPNMALYEDSMVRCALDAEWFVVVRQRLLSAKDSSPLFDTERWVRNLEASFRKMAGLGGEHTCLPDILISDDAM